jgi:hypothetical protein
MEYWQLHSQSEDKDDGDAEGCGGRSFAPLQRSLFQHLY